MKSLKYEYKKGETPEERLRNKLQPLFYIFNSIKRKEPITDKHLKICEKNIEDVNKILDDIPEFYKT